MTTDPLEMIEFGFVLIRHLDHLGGFVVLRGDIDDRNAAICEHRHQLRIKRIRMSSMRHSFELEHKLRF